MSRSRDLAALEVGEIKDGGARAAQTAKRPDPIEIIECGVIAGEQEMIAVVDDEAQSLVGVRSAAPSGGLRRLMQDHLKSGLGEANRGAQAGDAGLQRRDTDPSRRMPTRFLVKRKARRR